VDLVLVLALGDEEHRRNVPRPIVPLPRPPERREQRPGRGDREGEGDAMTHTPELRRLDDTQRENRRPVCELGGPFQYFGTSGLSASLTTRSKSAGLNTVPRRSVLTFTKMSFHSVRSDSVGEYMIFDVLRRS